jgi:hypothetical protein
MANTLTGLIPVMYQGLDIVARELVGMIPSVSINAAADMVAVGQQITIPVTPAASASDVTPAVSAPDDGDQVIGNTPMTITKARRVPIRWSGEEQKGYRTNGTWEKTLADQFAQAVRTLCNEVETDLANLAKTASRAYGTAGTTPFASNLADPAQVRKLLADNAAPMNDPYLVINTSAGAALRTLGQLTKANEAGTDLTLRRGVLLDLDGFAIRESAKIIKPAVGTGTGYLVNKVAGYAVGEKSIDVDTGTGTILAGDIVMFEDDTNKYVVTTGLTGGTIVIGAPGLLQTLADGKTVTVVAQSTRNFAFERSALQLLARVPAMPVDTNGNVIDMADDVAIITDPISGISFQVALYRQYRQLKYEICLAWGIANIKPEFTVLLLG